MCIWKQGSRIPYRVKLIIVAAALAFLGVGCPPSKPPSSQPPAPPAAQNPPAPQPSAGAPTCQVDPNQVATEVDQQLNFINPDALRGVPQAGILSPQSSVPPIPPSLPRYSQWLSMIAGAITDDQTPDPNPSDSDPYRTLSAGAYQELIGVGAAHYTCLNNPDCKDIDLQQAELHGVPMIAAGLNLFTTFQGQCTGVKTAAVNYLSQRYGVLASN
jgi:hypothetical protein